jgi:uncharacterized protein YjiK
MSKVAIFFTQILIILILTGCSSRSDKTTSVSDSFPFDLNSPDKKYFLPEQLREISGLSSLPNEQLACVQDEKGILFIFDLKTEQIKKEIKFGKPGDYEGVEVIGDKVYVIKSNGEIASFDINAEEPEPDIISTPLRVRNDVEGLGYNSQNNSLLIACKGKPDVNNNNSKGKSIYEYSLNENKFIETPFLSLTKQEMNLEPNKIKPSGIAMNPKTAQVFLLASSGEFFIFEQKKLSQVFELNPSMFTQAEGICINDNGSLFISSEGGTGKGYILRFDPKNK